MRDIYEAKVRAAMVEMRAVPPREVDLSEADQINAAIAETTALTDRFADLSGFQSEEGITPTDDQLTEAFARAQVALGIVRRRLGLPGVRVCPHYHAMPNGTSQPYWVMLPVATITCRGCLDLILLSEAVGGCHWCGTTDGIRIAYVQQINELTVVGEACPDCSTALSRLGDPST